MQRVLANVPTYMILDDHDLTDDFFLSPIWRRRVLGSALGQVILTNGMLAYALFQDWGNDPRRYDQTTDAAHPESRRPAARRPAGPGAELLPAGQKSGPTPERSPSLARMFGHHLDNQPDPDGRFRRRPAAVTWHFTRRWAEAPGGRPRQSHPSLATSSEVGPPGNVSPEALVDQLPPPPLRPAARC